MNETGAKEKLIPFLFNGAGNHFLYKNIIHIGCYSICYNTLFTKFEMLQSYRHFFFKCQSSPGCYISTHTPCSPPPDAFSFRLPLSIAGRTDRWNHTQFTNSANSTTLPHYVWTPFSWHSSYCTGHPLQLGSWHFLVARSVKSLPGIKLQQVRCPVPLPLPLLSNPLYWGTGTSNSDHVATGRP